MNSRRLKNVFYGLRGSMKRNSRNLLTLCDYASKNQVHLGQSTMYCVYVMTRLLNLRNWRALDPIRTLLPHPKWRRVLGFGWFDEDPSLDVGESYEYRITGFFPIEDLTDRIYSFHTIPSHTALPSEFYLGNLRIRISQPVTVKLSPDTTNLGLARLADAV